MNHPTIGHGVLSQYNANAAKEWQRKETRRQERSSSPEKKAFNPQDSFYSPSLNQPPLQPIEQLHFAMPRSLAQMQQLHKPALLKAAKGSTQTPALPNVACGNQKCTSRPPASQSACVGHPYQSHHYNMGQCQAYNHRVFSKASLITSRRP